VEDKTEYSRKGIWLIEPAFDPDGRVRNVYLKNVFYNLYLAVNPNRSVTLVDYTQKQTFGRFSLEFINRETPSYEEGLD